jgi:translation initiation factor IF-2
VSLKHYKEAVPSIAQGHECGIELEDFEGCQPGDIIECYRVKQEPGLLDG